ncbi:MAG: peptidyl-prolyl cis-trans isomerase [Pirellulales bacterium]|nr:peptidyl-prolyl cis-trans isomerase [Pirellulales bacterium]
MVRIPLGSLVTAVAILAARGWADEYPGAPGSFERLPPIGAATPYPGWNNGPGYLGPPSAPVAPARPDHWPGGPSDVAPPPEAGAPPVVPPGAALPPPQPCESAQIMGRVGTEPILAGEVRAFAVQTVLAELKRRKITPPMEEVRDLVDRIWPSYLDHAVEAKLLYVAARRGVPDEAIAQFKDRIAKIFAEEPSGLKQLEETLGVKTREQVEEKLEALGTSLAWQERLFGERIVSQQGLMEEVKQDDPITHEQMLIHYREHLADFESPAQARWEQLMVRFSRYPDKARAWDALARMGNLVQDGADFAEVARKCSDGPTAHNGGARDWTRPGSLVSETLDHAIFALPVGQLSPIIEDAQGYHIVRVVERKDAHRTPFAEAQEKIRDEIRRERFTEGFAAYVKRLKKETPVWTIHDEETAGSPAANAPPQVGSRPAGRY